MESDPASRCWVEVATPLSGRELWLFLQDIRRLFRLNPHWEIGQWQQEGDFCWLVGLTNELTGKSLTSRFSVTLSADQTTLTCHYQEGWKELTRFSLRPTATCATVLTLEEFYRSMPPDVIDHTLIPWGAAIHSFLVTRGRLAWFPPYAWYMEGIHLAMAPKNRRLTRLMIILSLAEFIFFLGILFIYLVS